MPNDDMEDLWRSAAILSWRNRIPDDCLNCVALNVCRGGCRAVAQKLNLSHDPLKKAALQQTDHAAVDLGMDDRPRLSCQVKMTSFGYALSGKGHYVTLSRQSRTLLARLDGSTTIETIMAEFGPGSLELIAGLFQQQLLELQ